MRRINLANYSYLPGFTLIELLVVISIIAIITTIGTTSLLTAQKQARDSARKEIIGNVQSAFEQYFAETGAYPNGNYGVAFESGDAPTDPREDDSPLTWNVSSSSYCVCATLENSTGNANIPISTACDWDPVGSEYCAQNQQ